MGKNKTGIILGASSGFIISTLLVYFILSYLDKVSGFNDYVKIYLMILLIFGFGILLKKWFGESIEPESVGFFVNIKEGFKMYGEEIATVVNSVLLTITYFIGVGLTSIFAKLVGKEFLDMKIDHSTETYWNELNIGDEDLSSHYRQF